MTPEDRARLILAMLAMLGLREHVSIDGVARTLEKNWGNNRAAELKYMIGGREFKVYLSCPAGESRHVTVGLKVNGLDDVFFGQQMTWYLNEES